jgi:ABC-type sulfate/molybdate transport systems ATPase subunit
MTAAVELIEARVTPEGQERAVEFTLRIAEREFVALIGPTRAGKSLVLEMCAGLVAPEKGSVRVLGRDLAGLAEEEWPELRVRVGTVLEQPGLLSNMTVFNNVALPLRYHRGDVEEKEVEARVMEHLDALGIASLRNSFPSQLRQGESRCAAIARALILSPALLLLDDPTGGLDAEMTKRLADYLSDYRQAKPVTILAALRAFSGLLDTVDRVVYLRDGRIEGEGRPSELRTRGRSDLLGYLHAGPGF